MKILCATIPERGHLNPLLPTLRRLEQRGHDIVVASARDLTGVLDAAGLHARAVVVDAPPPPADFLTHGRHFAERLRDEVWLRAWIRALLVDAARDQVEPFTRFVQRERPDVAVLDPMVYAAVIACQRVAVPWAGVSSSLNPVTPRAWRAPLVDNLDALADARRALFLDAGVDVPAFRVSDACSPFLDVVFAVDEWAPRAAADNAGCFAVGAPFDDDDVGHRGDEQAFPWERLDDDNGRGNRARRRRRVFCSFGSQAYFQPALFSAVFRAAQALDVQVVASCGDLVEDEAFLARAPADAVLCRYAPQLPLLSRVDVVVSHGGANSVVETLRHGLPLLLLPLCNDQHLQARFLDACGAGRVVDPAGIAPADVDASALDDALLRALRALLDDDAPERRRAEEISRSLQAAGGPARVADLVEELGRVRRPLRASDLVGAPQ